MKWTGLLRSLVPIMILSAGCHCPPLPIAKPAPIGLSECDFLSPVGSRLTDANIGPARQEVVVSATLLSRVPPPTSANLVTADELFMVMIKRNPYAPEEAVYILRTPARPTPTEYKVVHARAKESLLFKDVNDPSVGADFNEAPIDTATVLALERAWGAMALRARWPDREHSIARMKWGGTVYTFDYRGDNVYGQGDTVSPEHGACTGSLAELGDLLMRFADEPDANVRDIFRVKLLRQNQALVERLK